MTTRETRLDRLKQVYRHREPSASGTAFDPTRLSFAEQVELDGLLRHVAPLPGERWGAALESLSNEELDRAVVLTRKAEGLAPSEPYLYMQHRPPTEGECLCAACLAAAPPEHV